MVYYNENDLFAVQWLRNLINDGLIADGVVDDRDIRDVRPSDLAGFVQCHFFAGIGGWSYALRLAGWPDDKPVWTGSPPCQPFSVAGQQKGNADERHLAPHWLELVSQCRPSVVFGEQVTGAISHGWFDDLQTHLEAQDYACGLVVLPACSVGAPHIRQRLWFVAERVGESDRSGWNARREGSASVGYRSPVIATGGTGRLADTDGRVGGQGHPEHGRRHSGSDAVTRPGPGSDGVSDVLRLADTERLGRQVEVLDNGIGRTPCHQRQAGVAGMCGTADRSTAGPVNGFWRAADWLLCRDGKWRPAQPSIQPLAARLPGRVGLLRGAGNAINPHVAAEVIRAYEETA